MFLEVHQLQNFAPANLNRDDSNAPKDCEFGGYRRARISSQCLKRAMRLEFKSAKLLPEEHLAFRSKRMLEELTRRLSERDVPPEDARRVAKAVLGGLGFTLATEDKTQYLLYLAESEIDRLATVCSENLQAVLAVAPVEATEAEPPAGGRAGRGSRDTKQKAMAAVPDAVKRAALAVLDGGKAADLALWGRMLADKPEQNVFAASQVAHAISTNKVSMEFDFYTAVDDLKPEDTAGADMLGTVQYNSACFYRYANVDLGQLWRNLGNDHDLARQTVLAFLTAAVNAIPSGKQNSMAAYQKPSLVMAVLRERDRVSLANAFLQPARPQGNSHLVDDSVAKLDRHWAALTAMYGHEGLHGPWLATDSTVALQSLDNANVGSVPEVFTEVLKAVDRVQGGGR